MRRSTRCDQLIPAAVAWEEAASSGPPTSGSESNDAREPWSGALSMPPDEWPRAGGSPPARRPPSMLMGDAHPSAAPPPRPAAASAPVSPCALSLLAGVSAAACRPPDPAPAAAAAAGSGSPAISGKAAAPAAAAATQPGCLPGGGAAVCPPPRPPPGPPPRPIPGPPPGPPPGPQSELQQLRLLAASLTAANRRLTDRVEECEGENARLRAACRALELERDRLKAAAEPKALRLLPGDVLAYIFQWLHMKGLRTALRTCRLWRRTVISSKTVGPRLRQKILVIGGSDGNRRHDNVEQFDMFTSRWTTLLGPRQEFQAAADCMQHQNQLSMQLRQAKGAMAAAHSGDLIYIFGGFNNLPLRDAEVFNLRSRAWRELPPMRTERSKAAVAQHGGLVYVMGGYNGVAPLRSVECFDPSTEQWSGAPDMVEPRGAPAAVELGGYIYVIGGWKGNIMSGPHSALSSAERYDPREGVWSPIAPMRYARSTPSAVVLYGCIYVLGGYNGNDPPHQGAPADQRLMSVERYNPKTNSWDEVAPMRCGRSGEAAVAVDGRIFAIGGWDGQEHFDLVEVYSPVSDQWTVSSHLRTKRRDPAAVVYVAPPLGDPGLD
eukprot:TRINITY_DN10662_c0_g1_i1.p1 TRINITY_DN10662_c0_g1~~TRINITY_DN10662_c0_g1_i1.p1  ORF type:complete len:636 (+),score=158.11 TRINITY_DN10662_c0_g1_i1:93-1910(+)